MTTILLYGFLFLVGVVALLGLLALAIRGTPGTTKAKAPSPEPSVGADVDPASPNTALTPTPAAPASAPSVRRSGGGTGWWTAIYRLFILLLIGGLLFTGYHYRWDEWTDRQVSAFGNYMTNHVRVIRPEVEAVSRPTTINVRFAAAKPQEGETVEFDMFWNTQARHIPPVFTRQELGAQTTWSCAQLVPGQTDHGITNTPFTWSNWTMSFTPEFRALLERDEPVRVQLRLTHTALGANNPCPAMWRG